jgi:flagellar basal body-associated protein FliL
MSKKGSISLSINMIVVVVLAFVMLGLMLTLGQKIVGDATKTAEQVGEQTRQDITNKLSISTEPLYFNQRSYDVPFSKKITITFGMKNTNPQTANLLVKIFSIHPETGVPTEVRSNVVASPNYGKFLWATGPQSFRAGEGKVFDVQYTAPQGQDTYQFKFVVEELGAAAGDPPVAEQIIFINVI